MRFDNVKQKTTMKITEMKTILFGMIAILGAGVAMASGNLKVNLASNDAELAVVEITNTNMSNYEIELSDEFGNQLYRMETTAPLKELEKRYNLSELQDGNYRYTVKVDKEQITKRLAIEFGEIKVTDIRKTLEPYFCLEGDIIKLSYLNYEHEDIKVYLYDNDDTLLYESNLGNHLAIHRGFNLSALKPGTYDLVLINDYDIYHHTVKLD